MHPLLPLERRVLGLVDAGHTVADGRRSYTDAYRVTSSQGSPGGGQRRP